MRRAAISVLQLQGNTPSSRAENRRRRARSRGAQVSTTNLKISAPTLAVHIIVAVAHRQSDSLILLEANSSFIVGQLNLRSPPLSQPGETIHYRPPVTLLRVCDFVPGLHHPSSPHVVPAEALFQGQTSRPCDIDP